MLSLTDTRYRYRAGQDPDFTVSVVSTSVSRCRFNIGSRHLRVVVEAKGRRVWGSADCRARPFSKTAGLTRGVPAVLQLSWDRRHSAPGCRGEFRARSGYYQAVAIDGRDRSNPVRFRLG